MDMKEDKLGLEQAFPMEQHDGNGLYEIHHGMSKRFYAACAAMQGILANSFWVGSEKSINYEKTVSISFKMADELLKQENE